jgi:hypothetical protein
MTTNSLTRFGRLSIARGLAARAERSFAAAPLQTKRERVDMTGSYKQVTPDGVTKEYQAGLMFEHCEVASI